MTAKTAVTVEQSPFLRRRKMRESGPMLPSDEPVAREQVRAAAERARTALWGYQDERGAFDGYNAQGASSTAQLVIVLHFVGHLDAATRDEAARHLRPWVGEDGGVPAYPTADFSNLTTTALVRAALQCCGADAEEPVMRRLDGYIAAHGGDAGCDDLDRMFLVMAGRGSSRDLPRGTAWHLLIPGLEDHLGRTFIAYYGAMIGVLLPVLLEALCRDGPPGPLTRAGHRRMRRWLRERQNPDGNWGGGLWLTLMVLAALHVADVDHADGDFARGLACLDKWKREHDEGAEWTPYNSINWNTAVALRALRAPADDPRTRSAVEWLSSQQADLPTPEDWLQPAPGAPRTGGWAFAADNPLVSDTDTTAMVLWTLREHPEAGPACERALSWLWAMQNDDGGWPAFTRGQPGKGPEPAHERMPETPRTLLDKLRFFVRPDPEFVDITTADLTARVIAALGAWGYTVADPRVARAVGFLRAQQLGDTWWCRWTTGYIAASGFVVLGLAAVGVDPNEDFLRRAIRWVEEHQNVDGGFGEQNASYSNRALAGIGPSNAYLTGLNLAALCAVGRGHEEPARRAVRWLVEHQTSNGLWAEDQALQTLLPPELFYTNYVNFQTAALDGLASWLEA